MASPFTKKSKRYQRVAVITVSIVVLAALQPWLWQNVAAKALNLTDKRSQEQQINNVKERNSQMAEAIKRQQDYINQLEVVVPSSVSLTQIVDRLEQTADQYGLKLNIKAINETAEEDLNKGALKNTGIVKVVVALIAEGTVDRLLDYLDNVEHLQELAVVSSWSLKVGRQAEIVPVTGAIYTMPVDIIFYVHKNTQ